MIKELEFLQQELLRISKKLKLSHIGSNLSCLPVLIEIYEKKKPGDLVILSNAHAHLAHMIVRNHFEKTNLPIEEYIKEFGIHCDTLAHCDASGGSLSHCGVAIGRALANKDRKVYLIISEGVTAEGSFAESLRIAHDLKLTNLEIHANFNGFSATQEIDLDYLENWIKGFDFPVLFHRTNNTAEFDGIQGHYKTL